jgi:hypothetical protein
MTMEKIKTKEKLHRIGAIRSLITNLQFIEIDDGYELFYRGHYSQSFKLSPSIYRGKIKCEHELYQDIIRMCPNDFIYDTTFEKLVKMQHYQLPTRLVDITTNPLVALFFACHDYNNAYKNGKPSNPNPNGAIEVIAVKKDKIKYYDSNCVCILSNIAKMKYDNFKEDYSKYSNTDKEVFNNLEEIKELTYKIKQERAGFEYIKPETINNIHCVKPKLNNPRIIRQFGAFLIFGIAGKDKEEVSLLDIKSDKFKNLQMIVKDCGKRKILDELEQLGISEQSLFPEIDAVAHYLVSKSKCLGIHSTR